MPNPNASKASKPTKSLVPVIRLDDPRSRPNDYDGGGDGNDDDDEDCMYCPHIEQMQPKP